MIAGSAAIDHALIGTTCRDRLRQVLAAIDDAGRLSPEGLSAVVAASTCPVGHDLHYARLMSGLIEDRNGAGSLGLSGSGDRWLLDHGRPSPDWQGSVAAGSPPLRAWQDEALRAWVAHGRHGVVQAVTGTGKSRVGVEAAREAVSEDFSVLVVVPSRDLVDQWAREFRGQGVGPVGVAVDGQRPTFRTHGVIVGTVQGLYSAPPTREDGKVLLIADECHRYGAEKWSRVLHASYRCRLGLTATFERNDDGIQDLLEYFGGGPVFTIDFQRAIADGVVAHYDVQMLGVDLTAGERWAYDRADETVKDCRTQLVVAGFPAEPFGAFLHEVQKAAADVDGTEDPTIVDLARRYLKTFSERIEVMSNAVGKLDASRALAGRIAESGGAIVFTRRVDAAEDIARILAEEHVRALPIHANHTQAERRDRLAGLKNGRIKALVAPTILDEGVDVPDIDLAVVMGGSKSRRQMTQRMGRVLRLKPDGRKATFVVVYARNTVEDLTQSNGSEGCLDLIVESADSVGRLELSEGRVITTRAPVAVNSALVVASTPRAARADRDTDAGGAPDADPAPLALTRSAVRNYTRAHGVDDGEAATALRTMLRDFLGSAEVEASSDRPDASVLRRAGFELVVTNDRCLGYASTRDDALTWDDLRELPGAPPERASAEATVSDSAEPGTDAHDVPGSAAPRSGPRGSHVVPDELVRSTCESNPVGAGRVSTAVTAHSGSAAPQSAAPQTRRGVTTAEELLIENPRLLLDLIDPEIIGVDLNPVWRACDAFALGDPMSEVALGSTREILARDLRDEPDVTFAHGRFVVHGCRATWTISVDGQTVIDLVPSPDQPLGMYGAVEVEAASGRLPTRAETDTSGNTALDVVAVIERLAVLWERGALTDDEFTAAKAKVLS